MFDKKNYMNLREIILWLSIVFLSVTAWVYGIGYVKILIFWTLIILVTGNARRIQSQTHQNLLCIIRRNCYVLPMLFPLCWSDPVSDPIIGAPLPWIWVFFSFILGFCFLLPRYKVWRIVLSTDYIRLGSVQGRVDSITMIYIMVATPIVEEYFFRYFIITSGNQKLIVLNIFISAFLFFLSHYGTKWSGNFSTYDFIIQFSFGVCSAILFIVSDSLIPSILAHFVYNSMHMIKHLKQLKLSFETTEMGM